MIKRLYLILTTVFICLLFFNQSIAHIVKNKEMMTKTMDTYLNVENFCHNNTELTTSFNLRNEHIIIQSPFANENKEITNNIDFVVLKHVCNKFFQLLLTKNEFNSRLRQIYLATNKTYSYTKNLEELFYISVKNYACNVELHPSIKILYFEYLKDFVAESFELIFILSSKKFQRSFLTPLEYERIWSDIDKCIEIKFYTNSEDKLEKMFDGIKYKKIVGNLQKLADRLNDQFYATNRAKNQMPSFLEYMSAATNGLSLLKYMSQISNKNNVLPTEMVMYDDHNNLRETTTRYSSVIDDNPYGYIANSNYDYSREPELPFDVQIKNNDNSTKVGKNEYSTIKSDIDSAADTIRIFHFDTTTKVDSSTETTKKSDEETATRKHLVSSTTDNHFSVITEVDTISSQYNNSFDRITTEENSTNMTRIKHEEKTAREIYTNSSTNDDLFGTTTKEEHSTYKTVKSSDDENTTEVNTLSSTIDDSFFKTTKKEDAANVTTKIYEEETTTETNKSVTINDFVYKAPEETISTTVLNVSSSEEILTDGFLTVVDFNTSVSPSPYIKINDANDDNFKTELPSTITTEINKIDKIKKSSYDENDKNNTQPIRYYLPDQNYNNQDPSIESGPKGPGLLSKVVKKVIDVGSDAVDAVEDIAVEAGGAIAKKGIRKVTKRIDKGMQAAKGALDAIGVGSDIGSGLQSIVKNEGNSKNFPIKKKSTGIQKQKTHGKYNLKSKKNSRQQSVEGTKKSARDKGGKTKNTDGKEEKKTKKPVKDKERKTKNTISKEEKKIKKPEKDKERKTKNTISKEEKKIKKPVRDKERKTKKPVKDKKRTAKKSGENNKKEKSDQYKMAKNKSKDFFSGIADVLKLNWKILTALLGFILPIIAVLCSCFGKTMFKCCSPKKKNIDEEKKELS
ncbi:putative SP-containing membrane protein [Vairimorpha necatrix]|uniref:SP-containing membrane protein n=1 Tax=Vairimorpha necatrix TaxID=6039 RepID=A0AAX4JGJ8_9MICR